MPLSSSGNDSLYIPILSTYQKNRTEPLGRDEPDTGALAFQNGMSGYGAAMAHFFNAVGRSSDSFEQGIDSLANCPRWVTGCQREPLNEDTPLRRLGRPGL